MPPPKTHMGLARRRGQMPRCASKGWNQGLVMGLTTRQGTVAGPHLRRVAQSKAAAARSRKRKPMVVAPWGVGKGRRGRRPAPSQDVDPAEDFGRSQQFRSHPPQSMTAEEAVVANLAQFVLRVGVAPVAALDRPHFAQEAGWLVSREVVRQLYADAAGVLQLLERHPEKFRLSEDKLWVEPADQPFKTHNAGKRSCPFFKVQGLCREGSKCQLRHRKEDFTPKEARRGVKRERQDRTGRSRAPSIGPDAGAGAADGPAAKRLRTQRPPPAP
eukprot:EG_transcript_23821